MNVKQMKDSTLVALFQALSEEFVDLTAQYNEMRETVAGLLHELRVRDLIREEPVDDGSAERSHAEADNDSGEATDITGEEELGSDLPAGKKDAWGPGDDAA